MIKYPNGLVYKETAYKKEKSKARLDNAANRGMGLEEDISSSCDFYRSQNIALLYKRPTPIKIVKIDKNNPSKISEAFFSMKSTTDYNGVYKGYYMDFEAKETISKTSFSYSNIRPQQIEHLKMVIKLKGLAFFIIRMKAYNETYLLKCEDLFKEMEENKRKSISYNFLKEKGYLIKEAFSPRLDFLKAVDDAFFKSIF